MFLWWIATGLDGYVPNGGGTDNTVAALRRPATAGIGAGRRSALDPVAVGLVRHVGHPGLRLVLGIISAKVTAAITPKPKAAPAEA